MLRIHRKRLFARAFQRVSYSPSKLIGHHPYLLSVSTLSTRGLRISLVQLEVTPSKSENLRNVIDSLGMTRGCDLVVFPEYCMGYPEGQLTREFAAEIGERLNGDFVTRVAEVSREKQVAVVLPIFEKADGAVYNTAVVIAQGKVLGGYRKVHLFDALEFRESDVFQPGSELVLFTVREFTLGVIICYDVRFPELAKQEVMSGARVVIVPAGWVRGPLKEEQWQTLLMARAAENTSYVVGVGNAHETFIGRSIVVDPFGVKVLDLGYGNRLGQVEIDDSRISEAREKIPVIEQSKQLSAVKCRRL
jgi:predicted amidohydrolase